MIPWQLLFLQVIHATVDDVYPVEFGTPYDHKILDVHSFYGSPYGGFGRHSRETLARLPLVLQYDHEVSYHTVRDQNGQLFACRLYPEDALDPTTWKESMFNPPIFRNEVSNNPEKTTKAAVVPVVPETPSKPALPSLPPTTRVIRSSDSTAGTRDLQTQIPTDHDAVKVETSLKALTGVCGQVHKGYWSYEWCFENDVTQFHVSYDTKTNQVKIEHVTHLGKFGHRELFLNIEELTINEWAEELPEVARITDAHTDGSLCDKTPRRSFAKLQCCSDKVIKRNKGMLHKNGRPLQSDILAVLDVVEDPDVKCMYNFTICTPLLCGGNEDEKEEEVADPMATARLLEDLNSMDEINTDESIRQILDRTLAKLCLQTQTGGWWVYEICHKKSIRQYHETVAIRRNSAGAKVSSKVTESEHNLGKYDPSAEAHVKDEEEWDAVVNATADTSWGEGNGAYYQVEYTGGDTCDTSDVTDSAIVAGTAGKTVLRRAASVRYYCGQNFDVQVKEDTTCHYIVEVKVPSLCRHPLFRAPVSKKQIMKCIPIEDPI